MIAKNYNDNIELQLAFSDLDDAVFDVKEKGTMEAFDDYLKQKALIQLHLICIFNGLDHLDFQWLNANGKLSEKDREWFEIFDDNYIPPK